MGKAVRRRFGHFGRDAARGVQLRRDSGRRSMAEDFQTRIRAWGVTARVAFAGRPQANGGVERFFRSLVDQVVHGRVLETLDDLRDAVRAVMARHNAAWPVDDNGHLSPQGLRRRHEPAAMPMAV
jgi:transposase InsO family protein